MSLMQIEMVDEVDAEEQVDLLQTMYLFPVAVLQVKASGQISFMNPQATQLLLSLGLRAHFGDGWGLLTQIDAELADRARAGGAQLGTLIKQHRVQTRTGRGDVRHLALTVAQVTTKTSMVVIEDLTRVIEQERELHRQRAQFLAVLGAIKGYCVCDLDLEGRVASWNQSVGRTLGWDAPAIVGRPLADIVAASVDLPRHLADAARTGWSSFYGEVTCAVDGPVWVEAIVTALVDDGGVCGGYCIVARDVSERHAQHAQLVASAQQDPMTQLANRRGLALHAAALLPAVDRERVPLSVAAFDIDHFKRVNDSIGHAGGDAVLMHFVELTRAQVRDVDVLARVGGEEFLLLLRGLDCAGAARAVERIRAAVEVSVCLWQGQPVPFTVSIGVAERRAGEALEMPWERADQALYEAKHGGRNRVVCAAPGA